MTNDDMKKKKKKFSFLKALGFGKKAQVANNNTAGKKKDVFAAVSAQNAIKKNKAHKRKLLEQIK